MAGNDPWGIPGPGDPGTTLPVADRKARDEAAKKAAAAKDAQQKANSEKATKAAREKAAAEKAAAEARAARTRSETSPTTTIPPSTTADTATVDPQGTTLADLWQATFGDRGGPQLDRPASSVMGFNVNLRFLSADQYSAADTLIKQPPTLESIREARKAATDILIDQLGDGPQAASIGYVLAAMLPPEMLNKDALAKMDLRVMLSKLIQISQATTAEGKDKLATIKLNGTQTIVATALDEKALQEQLNIQTQKVADNARIIATEHLHLTGQKIEDYVASARDAYAIDNSTVGLYLKPDSAEVAKAAEAAKADQDAGGDGYMSWTETADAPSASVSGVAPADPNWTLEGLRNLANSGVDIWNEIVKREDKYKTARDTYAAAGEQAPAAFDPLTVGFNSFGFSNLPSWATTQPVNNSTESAFLSSSGQRFQDALVPKGTVRINDALNFMVGRSDPKEIKAVRDKLVAAGLLERSGIVWDDEAQTAWRQMLKEALIQQKQPMDILIDRAANIKAQSQQVSDPAQLKYQLDNLSDKLLGRPLTQGEFIGVRNYLINLEKSQDTARTQLNSEWFQVNEQNSAAEYLRRTNAVEADKVSRFQTMMQTQEALGNKMRRPKLTHEQQQEVMQQARANGWNADRTEQYIIEKYVMGWEA